jgi:hypothetical protein
VEVHFERLLSRKVVDADGRSVGRLEEIHARRRDGALVVTEYVLGAAGLMERLSLGPLVRGLLGQWLPQATSYTVGWSDMDLSDPERPRLHLRLADLRRTPSERKRRARRAE